MLPMQTKKNLRLNIRKYLLISLGLIILLTGLVLVWRYHRQNSNQLKNQAIVTITFDDGSKTIYDNAFPIFQQYHIPATFYLIAGSISEDGFVSWDNVQTLSQSGWEIASHTVTHPHLNLIKTKDQMIYELDGAKTIFAQHGYKVTSFAAPYGQYNSNGLAWIEEFYQSNRKNNIRGNPGINHLDKLNPYGLSSFEVGSSTSISVVKDRIDQAINQKGWLIIYMHTVDNSPSSRFEIQPKYLDQILAYISEKQKQGQIQVKTINQVVSMYPRSKN